MATPEKLNVLALGAGVQSSTLLLMSCLGELPRLDAAIFADTQWEPAAVYEHLKWLTVFSAEHGIPVHRVTVGDLRADALRSRVRNYDKSERWASMPLRTVAKDGSRGILRRQCTQEYKIRPMDRFIRRELLQLGPRGRAPAGTVTVWLGMSIDEIHRVKQSQVQWKIHRYPLVEKEISRTGCVTWLADHKFPRAPRSACLGCPYHTQTEWREIRKQPKEWDNAVKFDRAIRHRGNLRGDLFLHSSCRPLDETPLSDTDQGQELFAWADECDGVCGV